MKANPDKDFDELEYSLEEIPYPSPELDQTALKGAAAQEPDSYLVSPLPQFTGKLPSHLDSFDPMPEVVEEEEEEGYEQAYAPAPNCGAAGHPHSCKCASFSMFPDDIQYAEPRASPTRRPSFVARESPSFPATATDRPVLADSFEAVTDTTPSTPSGLSLTAPPNLSVEGRRSRSQSVTVSRTPSRSRPTSRGPTRPVSPSLKPAMIPSSQPRASSSRDPYAPVSAHLSIPQGREGEGLRTRLHDLLQDTGVSSSLPSMSSSRFTSSSPNHHPSAIAREKQALREDLTSRPASPRSGSSDYRLPQESTTDGYSHLLASHPPAHGVSTPMTTPSPNPRTHTGASSSASRAAAELERAQNERRKAEKEEKERRRAEKDMQRGKLDNVYTTPDVDARPRTSSTTSSIQAIQREQYIYGNPNISPNGISVSRHSPSTGGAYSSKPLSSGVSSLRREPSNVSATYQSRGYPTGTGKVSNIMPAAPTTGIYT
ncbi:hypothetical protein BDQ12DRAFT_255678 [Crucibulum laeve]|uniref:Uncharacterized protein n=1 Tax=Crucibulum laeve TaxID=68775 RepID=A0A5C3LU07_9AGAR|nr:hypothetical protein BDQ12DRAFT_255678 [Crucibulum laeve]